MHIDKFLFHELSWKDIDSLDKEHTVLLLPVGSTEQHGPQNPLGTDFLIAEYIAHETAKLSSESFCLPTLPIGVSSHHRDFPGTLWLSPDVFQKIIEGYLFSVHSHGFSKVIVVNGHGGNTSSILNAISTYNDLHNMICLLFEWWKDDELTQAFFNVSSALHADAVETSVVWAAYPDLVLPERFEGLTSSDKWGREIGGLYLPSRTAQFTSSGIAGSLENISKENGKKLLDASISKLQRVVEELKFYKV
ncbi:MAG: creatininase family protein [Candidatus Heimdallarchaeaceae archaeon]